MSKKIKVRKPREERSLVIYGMILYCKAGRFKDKRTKRVNKNDWQREVE